jgi:anthranilate synthase/aminodeoxychorismate synthase-like glutamine amidotransferase
MTLTPKQKVLVIDNYDSFTFNLVHYIEQFDVEIVVYKNDEISLEEINEINPSHIVISPGPCTPNESGISLDIISELKGKYPIFGVCLGHQAIGQAFEAKIVNAPQIMHGKTSTILNNGKGVFVGLTREFKATRYHSLVIDPLSLPEELEVTAWTAGADGSIDCIMAIKHKHYPIEGVQFHPESILSESGLALLQNFISR